MELGKPFAPVRFDSFFQFYPRKTCKSLHFWPKIENAYILNKLSAFVFVLISTRIQTHSSSTVTKRFDFFKFLNCSEEILYVAV